MAENVLSFLDARSLCAAELVSKEWLRVISEVRVVMIIRVITIGQDHQDHRYSLGL